MFRTSPFAIVLASFVPSVSSAHYLWITVRPEGENGTIDLVFEESVRPGDGHYLDPVILRGKTRLRTEDVAKTIDLKETTKDEKRWLSGPLPTKGRLSIESSVDWGVYRYGKTDAMLHYYAKHIAGETPASLDGIARSEKQKLDIAVTRKEDTVNVRVFWNNKPLSNGKILVRGPARIKHDLTTDAEGIATFMNPKPGNYLFRATVIEGDSSGEFEGKAYTQVRHTATLTTRLR